jgi:hypothetical protein
MSDLNEIAGRIAHALIPSLPYLLRIRDAAADEVGHRIGTAAWELAQALWEKLRPRRSVEPVAQAVVASPDNLALREALRGEIARALAEDPALQKEILRLMQSEVTQQVLAKRGSQIRDVVQEAEGGPTTQEIQASEDSSIEGVRQVRRR